MKLHWYLTEANPVLTHGDQYELVFRAASLTLRCDIVATVTVKIKRSDWEGFMRRARERNQDAPGHQLPPIAGDFAIEWLGL